MRQLSGTRYLSLMGLFSAIIFLLAFTPIGFIQLPFIKATIIHIPVIVGAVLLGPKNGAALGFLFGLASLINNTAAPAVSSFAFSPFIPLPAAGHGSAAALLICFVPRILTGVVPWFVYEGLLNAAAKIKSASANASLGHRRLPAKFNLVFLTVSGIAGSLVNTLLVMHMIFFFFKSEYASVQSVAIDSVYSVILGIIAVNGIPEALVAGMLTAAVCGVMKRIL